MLLDNWLESVVVVVNFTAAPASFLSNEKYTQYVPPVTCKQTPFFKFSLRYLFLVYIFFFLENHLPGQI